MKEQKKISVIVPIYKVEAYLPKCVESLRCQTHANLEIILVDDGSPDGCGAICDRFAEEDDRIRVIHKKNGGLSDARNVGIDIATGEYLAFVDSDDYVEPDALEAMLAAAGKHDVKMVCAGRYDVDGTTGQRKQGLCPEREEVVTGRELVRRIFRWEHLDSAAWDKLYARELFEGIRYPVGRVVEDVPTTYRIALRAERIAMLPKPVINYVHRENSITTASISEKTFHFYENTLGVYEDIREHFPELEPEAHYLLASSLFYSVEVVDLAAPSDREKFAERGEVLRGELRAHLPFICRYDRFSKRERLECFLLSYDLYRGLRRVYHLVKRS